MRISKEQAEDNRARVLSSATRLFREKGFAGIGVADIMGAAGMTHGGFYNHFSSKEALEGQACAQALQASVGRMRAVAEVKGAEARRAAIKAYRRRYVSVTARDAPAPNCPMVAFAGEMPRQNAAVREAFARGLKDYLAEFEKASEGKTRSEAIADFAALAGALILARSVAAADPKLSEEILAAANARLDREEVGSGASVERTAPHPSRL